VDAALSIIDPGSSNADATAGTSTLGAAQALASAPPILSRADWGADESLRTCCTEYGRVRVGFVHHTVGSNTYSAADAPAIIRGIYSFHVTSRGYRDIGYNFLVDRFGRVWEGRYGGVSRAVVGAHTSGYNYESFAMSAIGDFESATAPAAMVDAYSRVFAWKLGLHGVPINGSTTVDGKRFENISGHRDANSTACPGQYLYARLPDIRTGALRYSSGSSFGGIRRDLDGDGQPDVMTRTSAGALRAVLGAGFELSGPRRTLSTTFGGVDVMSGGYDLDGDRVPDLVTRDPFAGQAMVHPGLSAELGFGPGRRSLGVGWNTVDLITSVGDLSGDGRNDLVARDRSTGVLWLYRGDGTGGLSPGRTSLGVGWGIIDTLAGIGDADGDGMTDILGREPSGRLWLYRGDGSGRLVERRDAGTVESTVDRTVNAGDWDGDGDVDLLVRQRGTGVLWMVPNDGTGRFTDERRSLGGGWFVADLLAGGADVDWDGQPDVVARSATTTEQWLYSGDGRRSFAPRPEYTALPTVTTGLVGGDWDSDGRVDVMTVDQLGQLRLHRGDGRGGLDAGTVINVGWDTVRLVTPVGDFDGDGSPDLVAADRASGLAYLYRGNGRGGLLDRQDLADGWNAYDAAVGVGRWDADGAPDLLVRAAGTGNLLLLPGNGSGRLLDGVVVNTGWGIIDTLVGTGDYDGDGRPDLLGREAATGTVSLYQGDGRGAMVSRRTLGGVGIAAAFG